jgi:hypothetical protein
MGECWQQSARQEEGSYMKARLLAATAVGMGALAFVGTAAADPPTGTNAEGCVGEIVSNAAHIYASQPGPGGLGTAAKSLGVNVGEAIQAAAASACGKH